MDKCAVSHLQVDQWQELRTDEWICYIDLARAKSEAPVNTQQR